MLKNSRAILAEYLTEIVPRHGLKLARSDPGDFAIYVFGSSDMAVAVLRVIRAFGSRRFDGVIALVAGEAIEKTTRGRIQCSSLRTLHIANLDLLWDTSRIDESEVAMSVERFVIALSEVLRILLLGPLDEPLDQSDRLVLLSPISTNG